MNLSKRVIRGILWNFIDQFLKRGLQALVTLVLAYFLNPEDFGILAIVTVISTICISFMDLGFKEALIQKDTKKIDFDTAFFSNVFLGFLSYLLLYISAPYIANYYDKAILVELLWVVGFVIIINSFQVIQITVLSKKLAFSTILKANIPASIISSIVAVLLAYYEFGIWAVIYQMIIFSIINTLHLWFLKIYRPSLNFDYLSLSSMFSFGYKLFLSGIIDIVFRNIFVLIISKYFSLYLAGLYFFADKIKDLIINQVINSIQTVTYPALSSIKDDNLKLKESYRKIIKITTFIIFPFVMLIGTLSESLFELFLPQKWQEAALYLQIMCVSAMLIPLHSINLNILKVKARTDIFLYLEVLKKILLIIAIYISLDYGVIGLLIGNFVVSLLAYIPHSFYSKKLIDYSFLSQLQDFLPNLVLTIFCITILFLSNSIFESVSFLNLVLQILLFIFSYLVVAYIFKMQSLVLVTKLIKNNF